MIAFDGSGINERMQDLSLKQEAGTGNRKNSMPFDLIWVELLLLECRV